MLPEELERQITQRFGLRPQERWRRDLATALATLTRRHRLPAQRASAAIGADPRLLRELAGLLTIEETFFFRFPAQVDAALDHLGSRWWETPPPRFVLWSAGCSTGEEPYSLSIGVRDTFGPLANRCEVIACDINADAIARARTAEYGGWSFRGVPPALRDRCFVPLPDGRFRLMDSYRQAVRFEHLSIQEMAATLKDGSVEVVFFRNVGVYLDQAALARCFAVFQRVLSPTGLLIQAATDPTPPAQSFRRAEHLPVGVYRPAAAPDIQPLSVRSYRAGPSALPPPLEAPRSLHPPPHIEAVVLGDRGQLDRALETADRAVSAHPSDPGGLLLRGQLHLAADRADAAVEDLRRVLFLSPESWVARYWYILALRATGSAERAEGQVRELARQLAERPDGEILEDGTTRVGELRDALATLEAFYD